MADTTRPFLKADEDFFDLEGVGNGVFTILLNLCGQHTFQFLLSQFSRNAMDFLQKFVVTSWLTIRGWTLVN